MIPRSVWPFVGAFAVLLAAGVWTVIASAVSLAILGQLAYFRAPWWQWWLIWPYWRLNWLEALAIWGGAIIAVLCIIPFPGIFHVALRWSQRRRAPLYGRTEWASGAELYKGGFRESRRPD